METQVLAAINYNGWSNQETLLANLWLTNEEGMASIVAEAKALKEHPTIQAEWLAERVGEQLDWFIDSAPDYYRASLWVDWVNTAFRRVDWCEVIAKS